MRIMITNEAERDPSWTTTTKLFLKVQNFSEHSCPIPNYFIVPSLPTSRVSNLRQRGEETPSHPGGLSEVSRKRLEEHRRNRDKQRGRFNLNYFFWSV